MSDFVRSERSGDTVTVTLCNPAKRNSLGLDVLVGEEGFGRAPNPFVLGVME